MTRIVLAAMVLMLGGCGGCDRGSDLAPDPASDSGADFGANDASPMADAGVDMVDDQPPRYHSEPLPDRCAGPEPARCADVTATDLEPATASALDYQMLSQPKADCMDRDEYAGSGDALGCAFQELDAYIQGPLEPYHIQTPFIWEVYDDAGTSRIGIYEVDETGIVVDADYPNGARSLWGFDEVVIDETNVSATGGIVPLRTDYWGFPMSLTIRNASFDATIVTNDAGDTVLDVGEVSGFIEVLDLHDSLNAQASFCAGEEVTPFVETTSGNERCDQTLQTHEDETCRGYGTYCRLFQVFPVISDVDLNDDDIFDGFSVRFDVEFVEGVREF